MGRAAIGAAAKSKTGSVRVTPAQYKMFEERFGGLGKFLQMQVNEQLAKWHDDEQDKTK
jgi:hypothetical protein